MEITKSKNNKMKITRLIFTGAAILSLVTLGACDSSDKSNTHEDHSSEQVENREAEMHGEHIDLQDNFAHTDILILEKPYSPEKETEQQLIAVVKSYLEMKDAFIKGDTADVNRIAGEMKVKVEAVDAEFIEGEGKEAWIQHASIYNDKITEMQHIRGLKEKRSYFSHISEIIYCTVKSFELKGLPLYVAYCPMANNNNGAYWLAESEEIRNPYFGQKMLGCGKVEEKL